MQKHARKHRAPSTVGSFLIMAGIAALVFVLTSLFFAMITYLLNDPASVIPLLSLPAFLLSGAITSLILCHRGKDGMLRPLLAAALFLFVLLLIGVIAAHGALSFRILLYDIGYVLAFVAVYLIAPLRHGRKKGRHFRE